jgi:antiviral helicase SKI2
LNFSFYEIIFEWANKKPFSEVVKLNNIDEGIIIRMVNSVERVCQHVKSAARIIGDANLAQRMDQASTLIKRDIIFTPSLYLE